MKTLARPEDTAEILRRLFAVRADTRRRWGRMTAPQMVCHLSDSFRMVTGEKTASEVAHLLNRTVVKWIALYAPLPWPKARIETRPEVDQLCGGTPPAAFADDVRTLEALVERFTANADMWERKRHPVFGRMRTAEWMRWGYRHMDHHLRQFGC